MARISVADLYELIRSGRPRPSSSMCVRPRRGRSSRAGSRARSTFRCDDVGRHIGHLPRDREIVLYCTCPSEASAARVAKILMNHGFKRVRPLFGGLDAWIAAGYAVETAVGQTRLDRRERHRTGSAAPSRASIVGAGFGGLGASAQGLAGAGAVRITIVDQRNHHLFQPLLYQVGTGHARDLGNRLADPPADAQAQGSHDTARRGERDRCRAPHGAARGRRHARLRHAGAGHRRAARLFRPRRMGAACPRTQDIGGRHLDPAPDPAVLRARRARNRPRAPRARGSPS